MYSNWIMCTKDIRCWVSVDILDCYPWSIPSINTRLMLSRHLNWHSINTQSTSWLTVSQELTNFRRHTIECCSIHMSWLTFGWLSSGCRSNVHQVPIEMSIKCWSRVDQGYQLILDSRCLWYTWSKYSIEYKVRKIL